MDTALSTLSALSTLASLEKLPLAWGRALDRADRSILDAILGDDVVVDMTRATERIGLEFPVLSGKPTVLDTMIAAVGPLDTMHLVGNVLVEETRSGATVEAYALAQHFAPGEGADPAATRHALMGNTWNFELRWTGERYSVVRFEMDCLWMEGDPLVLLAAIS
ncbi:hypothetical protein GTU73_09655 [Rathayibacter sp. VKM Ac-2804]|uniref:nuclear transport factor 2 family protein n=1 Tax=Rathayibacter sp. VKM Ac-2804 TaxID=2609257 RepID=UPI00132EB322|nr:nuclear transport factor 2 family protein [Rathayibacter sp. VKM Ac-2804]QHF24251.1 hypothetical protein GTU73_09655 [Rathayibacter sp. VKM Ac-2804]